jgi:hypothetical protein
LRHLRYLIVAAEHPGTAGSDCVMSAGNLLGNVRPHADRAPAQQAFEGGVDGAELAVARRAVEILPVVGSIVL